jgi:2-polyprenyl-3-methyl-5-hydroxy-6-metoxy-1,4-benzoquinol methylase
LDRLLEYLQLEPGSRILDLGCGRGRHSIYLASKGYNVTGVDIVQENIDQASKHDASNLVFIRHDMRNQLPGDNYDAILNLFTSFGYFESENEDIITLQNVSNALKSNGVFVLDYLNAEHVKSAIIPQSRFSCDGVEFNIHKCIDNNYIVKDIEVLDRGEKHIYREQVKLLTKANFEQYFKETGLKMKEVLGDYHLTWFDEASSDRLILIALKKHTQE